MTGYGAVSQSVHCSGSSLGLPEPRGTADPLRGGEREVAWTRPPFGSFAHLSVVISNVPSFLPLKTNAGRRQCPGGFLAGTGNATTGETVTSWPRSDGPPGQ